MKLVERLKTSPLWLLLPSLLVAGAVGAVAVGYEPLVFDPSQYETPKASAAELDTIDAEALEAKSEKEADATQSSATVASNGLKDGTWTGYAACGVGNSQGWKPYYVAVQIVVSGGKVTKISKVSGSSTGASGDKKLTWDASENQSYLNWAKDGKGSDTGVVKQINAKLSSGSNVSGVDTVSGATYSSVAIYNAYVNAAGSAAGSSGASNGSAGSSKAATAATKTTKKKTKTVKKPTNVGVLADGTWTGFALCGPDPNSTWKAYYVAVTVTVKGGKVVSIEKIFGTSSGDAGSKKLNWDASENQVYLDSAVYGVKPQVEKAIAVGKHPASIDTVSGATYSSKSIFDAYYAALKKSAAAGGTTVSVPEENTPSSAGDAAQGGEGTEDNGGENADINEDGSAPETDAYYGYAYCSSSGSDSWSPYYIFVKLKAPEGAIPVIEKTYGDVDDTVGDGLKYNAAENALYLNWAIEGKFGGTGYRMKSVVKQIQAKLDEGAAVSGISTVSGATRSSKAILEAYKMAAANAEAGAGTTPAEAVELQREAGQ